MGGPNYILLLKIKHTTLVKFKKRILRLIIYISFDSSYKAELNCIIFYFKIIIITRVIVEIFVRILLMFV